MKFYELILQTTGGHPAAHLLYYTSLLVRPSTSPPPSTAPHARLATPRASHSSATPATRAARRWKSARWRTAAFAKAQAVLASSWQCWQCQQRLKDPN